MQERNTKGQFLKGSRGYWTGKQGDPRKLIPRVPRRCRQCQKPFEATQYEVDHGRGLYCSTDCHKASRAPNIPPLLEMEYGAGASTVELGRRYGVSSSTIAEWLRKRGMTLRTISEANVWSQTGIKHSPEWNAAIARGHLGKPRPREVIEKLRAANIGRKHSPEEVAKIRKALTGRKFTPEQRERISRGLRGMPHPWCAGKNALIFRQPDGMRYATRSGRREALGGLFVRSSWENNYALYLSTLVVSGAIVRWRYEPFTFWFHQRTTQPRSYTSDFAVWECSDDPRKPDYYVEVKGYMDPLSQAKLVHMRIEYPLIVVRLVSRAWFRTAERNDWCQQIAGWECRHTMALKGTS